MGVAYLKHHLRLTICQIRCDICNESTFRGDKANELLASLENPGAHTLSVITDRDGQLWPQGEPTGDVVLSQAMKAGWQHERRWMRPWVICPACVKRQKESEALASPLKDAEAVADPS
jgi:hypothetical protein